MLKNRSLQKRYKTFTLNKYLKEVSQQKTNITKRVSDKRSGRLNFQDFQEFVFLSSEKKKKDFGTNIRDEYMEKVLLYGYIMVI